VCGKANPRKGDARAMLIPVIAGFVGRDCSFQFPSDKVDLATQDLLRYGCSIRTKGRKIKKEKKTHYRFSPALHPIPCAFAHSLMRNKETWVDGKNASSSSSSVLRRPALFSLPGWERISADTTQHRRRLSLIRVVGAGI